MPANPNFGFGFGGYGLGRYGNPPIMTLPSEYYIGLITSQYQGSPKMLAWLRALLDKASDVSNLLATFVTEFDADTAVGAQLDILGLLVGANRIVPFQPSGGVSPILDDDTYRILIKAKIARNMWDGNIDSLQGIWQDLFPGGTLTIDDNQDMSVTILMSGAFSSIIQDLIINGMIVPRPETVLYNYTFATMPILGFDQNNAFIAGFDVGKFS